MELINTIRNYIFNLKASFFHRATASEIQLINNTQLFTGMRPADFNSMIKTITLCRLNSNQLVLREGEEAYHLYIIAEGAVRVYTCAADGKEITLARLNSGDYFGEQAFLGQAVKTRNANVKTITPTTLIKINEQYITNLLNQDASLTKRLKKKAYQQALSVLSASVELYNEIDSLIADIETPLLIEPKNEEYIFKLGESANNVYIVLQGQVELVIPQPAAAPAHIFLHRGNIFGELGVLESKPRTADAIAHGHARLVVVEGNFFKKQISLKPHLQQMLAILKHTYQLPKRGVLEQYVGNITGMGTTVTNIFKMKDGRCIVSSQFLQSNIFIMEITSDSKGIWYTYQQADRRVEINIFNQRLMGIKAIGIHTELPELCQLMFDNQLIEESLIKKFIENGSLMKIDLAKMPESIICACMSITKGELQEKIKNGAQTLTELQDKTGVATICRGCQPNIQALLGDNIWMPASIKKIKTSKIAENFTKQNQIVTHYRIKALNGQLIAFAPGQYIILQIKVDNHWVERAYIITDQYTDGDLRISVAHLPQGLLSSWLLNHPKEEFQLNISYPHGHFVLRLNNDIPALAFASGIGITPFIAFAKALARIQSSKKLFIVYFAATDKDFIFKDEFHELSAKTPALTIKFITENDKFLLAPQEIKKIISSFGLPDIYICAELWLEKLIVGTLEVIDYSEDKIHIEPFLHE